MMLIWLTQVVHTDLVLYVQCCWINDSSIAIISEL